MKRIKCHRVMNIMFLIVICISLLECSKDKKNEEPSSGSIPETSNVYLFATELNTNLINAGLSPSEAKKISDGAMLEAKPLIVEKVSKYRGLRGPEDEDISSIAPAIVKGAMKSIPEAGLDDALTAIGVISGSPIQSLFGRIGSLTEDQKTDLIKSIVEACTGSLNTAGLSQASKIAEAAKEITKEATKALGKAGFSNITLADSIEKVNFGAVTGIGNIQSLISDFIANIAAIMSNITSGSVGSLNEIEGLTQEQIAYSARKAPKGAISALDDAGITDVNTAAKEAVKGAIGALDDAGLEANYISNATLGILDAAYNALTDAGISDITTMLEDMKTSAQDGLSDITSVTGFDSASASNFIDSYDPNNFSDPFASAMSGDSAAVATPTFSAAGGTYTTTQIVTISTSTPDAVIWYTTNGTDPTCTTGTEYTSAVSISSTSTLKAMACLTDWTDSSVASATFTITGSVATPTFSVAGGTYATTQIVTISTSTPDAVIWYTTNGTDPTCTTGTEYTSAVSISSTSTLKAMACLTDWTDSIVASATYTITETVATPTFSPAGGTYYFSQSVTISTTTTGSTIWYTTNGSTPACGTGTSGGAETSSASVSVPSSMTIKGIACKTGSNNSSEASADYTIDIAKIYVANYTDGTVSVIDSNTNTVTDTITVGTGPFGVGVNPTTNKIYVGNHGSSNDVSVIDGTTDTVSTTISAVGGDLRGVGVNPNTNKIYVADEYNDYIVVIDGSTDDVITGVNYPILLPAG